MENQDKNQDKKWNDTTGYLFVGCMFIGIAVGLLLDKPEVGIMGGLGVGFIVSAVYRSEKNK